MYYLCRAFDEWSDARVAEEARLESVYTSKAYPEFESRSLRIEAGIQHNGFLLFLLASARGDQTTGTTWKQRKQLIIGHPRSLNKLRIILIISEGRRALNGPRIRRIIIINY